MYKVKVQNVCKCFLKSGMPEEEEFDSKDDAKAQAESMLASMESNFCKKHEFSIKEQFGSYTVFIKPRER